jgi:hypothetical protein
LQPVTRGISLDHRGADLLMFAPTGIAEADDFHPLALLEDGVGAAVDRGVGAGRPHELRGWRGTAGGKEDQGMRAFMAAGWQGLVNVSGG